MDVAALPAGVTKIHHRYFEYFLILDCGRLDYRPDGNKKRFEACRTRWVPAPARAQCQLG